jgi:hypothetical protein
MDVQNTVPDKNASGKELNAQFNADLNHFYGNWIWRAVECLVEAPDFDPSPKWAAKRLNVSVEKIVDAMEGLIRLGYVERTGSSFKSRIPEYHLSPDDLTREQLLEGHSKLAPQVISKLKPTSKFTTWFFLGNEDLVKKYGPKFMDLYAQMHAEGLKSGMKEVIASEIGFAIVTNENGVTGGRQ